MENTLGRTAEDKVRRSVLPTLKLGHYDGSTCWETFLAKYENCSDYYTWNERERLPSARQLRRNAPVGEPTPITRSVVYDFVDFDATLSTDFYMTRNESGGK